MATRPTYYPGHNSSSITNHQYTSSSHPPPPPPPPLQHASSSQQHHAVEPHSYHPSAQPPHTTGASLPNQTITHSQTQYTYSQPPQPSSSAPPTQHPYPPQQQQHPHHPTPPPPQSATVPPLLQQPVHHPYPSPQSALPPTNTALPRIQHQGYQSSPTSAGPQDPQSLPPFRHPAQSGPSSHPHSQPGPGSHEPREQQHEYQAGVYTGHNHNSHEAAITGVGRTYSHETAHQQTPTTPVQPGGFPPAGAGHPTAVMDHTAHYGYAPNSAVAHAPPHPNHGMPPPHHEAYLSSGPDGPHNYPHAFYGPMSNSFSGGTAKRKQMRASQACEQCRQRKQKCDEGNPCSFCKESNLSCVYRDAAPPKADKNLEKFMAMLEGQSSNIQLLISKMGDVDNRLQKLETTRESTLDATSPIEVDGEEPPKKKRKTGFDDHRTAPHKLLTLWPSIRPMLKQAGIELKDSYVMEAEDRGVLRIHTKGEGLDEGEGSVHAGPASPARSDEIDETLPPSPPEGVWGTGFAMTPNTNEIRPSNPASPGGMRADNTLDLDYYTIIGLLDSFMKNMHIMHPFVDRHRLKRMFESFMHSYATNYPPPSFVESKNGGIDRGPKRQKMNGSMSVHNSFTNTSEHVIKATEHSPTNAIVYLVMALGKLYQHEGPVPGPLVDDKKTNPSVITAQHLTNMRGSHMSSSPVSTKMKPSPASPLGATPRGHGHQHTPPLMDLSQSRSRRSSFDNGSSVWTRNIDHIPGMAYFAKALEILGEQTDGSDLVHAQMFLLAGLYKGALARVKESMGWFAMAGRVLRVLLDRYKLFNDEYWNARGDLKKRFQQGQKAIKDTRTNLIVLASWTCLQLESDILAELPLPSSGIQDLEGALLLPHKVSDEEEFLHDCQQDDYDDIMLYYTAQFWLRKRLNQVHRELYGAEALEMTLTEVQIMLRTHEDILSHWRRLLGKKLYWEDEDEPARDILNARLRAKYWGARYVVNRPFLDYALHIMAQATDGHPIERLALDANNNPREKAEIHLFEAIRTMPQSEIFKAAQRCIMAAMQSTIAFDNVPGRLIVTNIHGTAHAQFGNMLVLSATYESKAFKDLVDESTFRKLLIRTITFLRSIPNSPTCKIDRAILEKLYMHHFNETCPYRTSYHIEGVAQLKTEASFKQSLNSSFGSNQTVTGPD